MNKLKVFINNEIVFEFDREISLEDQHLTFLDKMDADMKSGIKIHGELLSKPDGHQRATFVAMNLIKAFQQNNDAVISASCTYLVNQNSDLQEVHANDQYGVVNIEFVKQS